MIKNNRNNEQIYGRNDMIMLDQNNKIYGSLGLADKYVMKTEEGTRLTLSNPKQGKFGDVLTEFNMYGRSEQLSTTGANLIDVDSMLNECLVKNDDGTYSISKTETNRFSKRFPVNLTAGTVVRFDANVIDYNGTYNLPLQLSINYQTISPGTAITLDGDVSEVTIYQDVENDVGTYTKFKNAILSIGRTQIPYEPYTSGKPSPNPEYPQEIVSVGQKLSTGKNLINADDYYSVYKQADGMYKVNNVKLNSIIIIFDSSMVGKTYTASCSLNCPNTVSGVVLEANIDSKKVLGNIIHTNESGISKVTFTPKTARDSIKITYGDGRGDVIFSDFQIEASSFATSYEPYTGGVPALYQKDIEVNVRGKNMLNSAFLNSTFSVDGISAKQNSDGRYTISGTPKVNGIIILWIGGGWNNTIPIFTIPQGNYYSNVSLLYYDGKNRTSKRGAFTLLEPFSVTGVMYAQEYVINEKYNFLIAPQLELGSEATSYEPYQEEQTVSLPYILNAIPVPNGGNYTDQSGQQYIADYVDMERGKVVRKIGKVILTGEENWEIGFENWKTYPHVFRAEELKKDILKGDTMNAKYMWYQKHANLDLDSMNAPYDRCIAVSDIRFSSVNEFTNELKKQNSNGTPLIAYYITSAPQEENLSLEEIEFLKLLSIYYPVTIIENNYNTWMKATYKSTESV